MPAPSDIAPVWLMFLFIVMCVYSFTPFILRSQAQMGHELGISDLGYCALSTWIMKWNIRVRNWELQVLVMILVMKIADAGHSRRRPGS